MRKRYSARPVKVNHGTAGCIEERGRKEASITIQGTCTSRTIDTAVAGPHPIDGLGGRKYARGVRTAAFSAALWQRGPMADSLDSWIKTSGTRHLEQDIWNLPGKTRPQCQYCAVINYFTTPYSSSPPWPLDVLRWVISAPPSQLWMSLWLVPFRASVDRRAN